MTELVLTDRLDVSANADVELDVPRIEAVVVDDEASASTYQSNASLTSTIVWLMSLSNQVRGTKNAPVFRVSLTLLSDIQ